jgi:hypothetical protein
LPWFLAIHGKVQLSNGKEKLQIEAGGSGKTDEEHLL